MASFGTITANDDTDLQWIDGPFIFKANGTWGGGTFVVKFKYKAATFKDWLTATALTSDVTGQVLYDVPIGTQVLVKATLSGATTPSLAWEFIGPRINPAVGES